MLILLSFCVIAQAQSETQNLDKMAKLRAAKIQYHQLTDGEYEGFRVNIHSGGDRENARKVKAEFQKKYPDTPVYEKYDQPNFTILVGDFKTELEAWGFREAIIFDFPNAFVKKRVLIKPAKL